MIRHWNLLTPYVFHFSYSWMIHILQKICGNRDHRVNELEVGRPLCISQFSLRTIHYWPSKWTSKLGSLSYSFELLWRTRELMQYISCNQKWVYIGYVRFIAISTLNHWNNNIIFITIESSIIHHHLHQRRQLAKVSPRNGVSFGVILVITRDNHIIHILIFFFVTDTFWFVLFAQVVHWIVGIENSGNAVIVVSFVYSVYDLKLFCRMILGLYKSSVSINYSINNQKWLLLTPKPIITHHKARWLQARLGTIS